MARKKKPTLKVELHLPKDDKTESRFIIILIISMLVAIGFFGFWLTNFLPHPNGEPIFINSVSFRCNHKIRRLFHLVVESASLDSNRIIENGQ